MLAVQTGVSGGTGTKLRGRMGRGDGFVALRLDGIVDEHNGLAAWLPTVGQGDALLIDLGGVKRLNSVGVRDWVNWLRALRPKWKTIALFDCPPAVMNEVNFVKNFAEGAVITTFHVPLFCQTCGKEENRPLDALILKQSGSKLPSFRCDRSDCENALDDDEESYLSFLAGLPSEPDPARLARLTAQAREALRDGAAQAIALDAANNASPARANALSQLGLHAQPTIVRPLAPAQLAAAPAPASPAAQAAGAAPAPSTEKPEPVRGDWLFVGAIAAMVAVLGVLIYLLVTLE